jgi:hypothetical protein
MPAVHLTVLELRVVVQALASRAGDCPLVDAARRQLQLALDRATRGRA